MIESFDLPAPDYDNAPPISAFRAISLALPPLFVAAAIFYLSSNPHAQIPVQFYLSDKIAHFSIFGLLSFLIYRALSLGFTRQNLLSSFLLSVVTTIIYGAGDEFHQRFVAGRYCEIGDLAADGAGALVFAFAGCFYQRKANKTKKMEKKSGD